MSSTDVFRALSDPTRRAVFERLASREASVSEITHGLPVSQPAVSQHLSVLREAGLVEARREGRRIIYRARPDGLSDLVSWVDRFGLFWPERIRRLRDILTRMDQ